MDHGGSPPSLAVETGGSCWDGWTEGERWKARENKKMRVGRTRGKRIEREARGKQDREGSKREEG